MTTRVDSADAGSFLKIPDAAALYDHLTNVLLSVVKERPENALSAFESNSVTAKGKPEPVPTDEKAAKLSLVAAQTVLDLIKPPKKNGTGEDGEEEEEEEEKEQAAIPDLMAEASLLEWAGVSMPEEERYLWTLSVQQLATEKELTNVRFWGIIRGTKRDYFIVEAKLEEYPEEEGAEGEESKNEAMGSGANECLYYVTNSATESWIKLPAVKATHIILATQMKRFFTGELSASVLGFPRFPYGEGAYLRAQIARITAGAFALPAGVLSVDPDDEEQAITENEEYAGITPMLAGPSSWVHGRTHLLKEGRTTAWVSPDADEEEEEDEDAAAEKKDEEKKEVPPPKLRAVGLDEGAGWKFNAYPHAADPSACVSAICIRWPGSVTVAQGKTCVNFYCGYGQKLGGGYAPPSPPLMAEEYVSGFDAATAADGEVDPLKEMKDELPPDGWTPPEEGEEEEEVEVEEAKPKEEEEE